jgi:hypothetical protein
MKRHIICVLPCSESLSPEERGASESDSERRVTVRMD